MSTTILFVAVCEMVHKLLPRRHERPVITETNLAPVIDIISWLLLAFMILSAGTRFLTKLTTTRKLLSVDDLFASLALALAGGQTACVLLSTSFGLGRAFDELPNHRYESALKAELVGELLFLLSLWAAKISVLCFLNTITPARSHRRALRLSGLLFTAWALTGVLANGFQCTPPRTWDYINNRCFNRLAFKRYLGISNILTEVIVIALPAMIILSLKTTVKRKVTILTSFSARVLVIAAVIGQLIELNSCFTNSDLTLGIWSYQVCTQCVQAMSIITSCVPYLTPFLESLRAGAFHANSATIRHYGETLTRRQTVKGESTKDGYIRVTRDVEIVRNVSGDASRPTASQNFLLSKAEA